MAASFMSDIETSWFVITGGPSSGKTKTTEYLAFLGYPTVPESARILIDIERSRGKTLEKIRANEAAFQRKAMQMKVEVEGRVPPEQLTFFDRGIPDSIAYHRLYNQDINEALKASKKRRYKGVFLLERLPFENDYARIETEDLTKKIDKLLYDAYATLGYKVVKVPVKTIPERVEYILKQIK